MIRVLPYVGCGPCHGSKCEPPKPGLVSLIKGSLDSNRAEFLSCAT